MKNEFNFFIFRDFGKVTLVEVSKGDEFHIQVSAIVMSGKRKWG